MTWSTIELSKCQKDKIKLYLFIVDEIWEWARLTNELDLYQEGIANIFRKSGVDYLLNLKEVEGVSMIQASGVGDFNPNDPEDRDKFKT